MTRNGLRLAVFDCDGTLVDSQATIVATMSAAFLTEGLDPPPDDAVRALIGLRLADGVAALLPNQEPERQARVVESYRRAHRLRQSAGEAADPLFPGIVAALDELEAAGFLLGVATGKGRRGLDLILANHGLARRFATLQTADVAAGKPHPEMLHRAMAEAGVGPAETIMIGDTTFDMQMAKNARTGALGVAWGYHPVAALHAAGADAVVDAASAIGPALARLRPA